MKVLLRAAIVGLFLFTLQAAQPAAVTGCNEYQCTIYVGGGGGGYYCIEEGEFDCICNEYGCVCGYCECFDSGDCFILPCGGGC